MRCPTAAPWRACWILRHPHDPQPCATVMLLCCSLDSPTRRPHMHAPSAHLMSHKTKRLPRSHSQVTSVAHIACSAPHSPLCCAVVSRSPCLRHIRPSSPQCHCTMPLCLDASLTVSLSTSTHARPRAATARGRPHPDLPPRRPPSSRRRIDFSPEARPPPLAVIVAVVVVVVIGAASVVAASVTLAEGRGQGPGARGQRHGPAWSGPAPVHSPITHPTHCAHQFGSLSPPVSHSPLTHWSSSAASPRPWPCVGWCQSHSSCGSSEARRRCSP